MTLQINRRVRLLRRFALNLPAFATITFPGLLAPCSGQAATHYVNINSPNPSPPYTTWDTAAGDIQSAVDVAVAGDLVLVTNGTYATGGRAVYGTMTNRVAIDRAISVQSVNGPGVTVIRGYQLPGPTNGDGAIRCVYLTNGASLAGFTLTNGATRVTGDEVRERSGGGLWCEPSSGAVSNCVLARNLASYCGGGAYAGTLRACTFSLNATFCRCSPLAIQGPDGFGGGAYASALEGCVFLKNSAYDGAGAYSSSLNNCTLTSNTASNGGGGTYWCTLNNCTLAGNSAYGFGGGASYGTLNGCTVKSNSALYGGGVYSAALNSCTILGNFIAYSSGRGGGAYLSTLTNCTLTGNRAVSGGGAAAKSILEHCMITANVAAFNVPAESEGGGVCESTLNRCILKNNHGSYGGGAFGSTLNQCLVVGNSGSAGGGTYNSRCTNCTITSNSANWGGGAYEGTLKNCIIYFNTASVTGLNWPSDFNWPILDYCCTSPEPPQGIGNVTNAPAFVDSASGNLRLRPNSSCINAGTNAYAPGTNDLDGRPRIVGGTVDIGAYEFQGAALNRFISWLEQYGLPTDGSVDYADADGDHLNNWQEWIAGTSPTNASSALQLLGLSHNAAGATVSWQSVSNRLYFLERSTNLSAHPTFLPLANAIPGQPEHTTYTDSNAPGPGPYFYRVGVQGIGY